MNTGNSFSDQLENTDSLIGTSVADRYRVVQFVSEGSSTLLFNAIDDETGRAVTLKLIRPALTSSPAFRQRFDENMRAAATLSHPNIAAVYDWGSAKIGAQAAATVVFVVVEHLTGGSLRDMLDRGRRLSPSQALAVGLDACKALDYAHQRGQIHTEINPSKLVFGDDHRLRIVDFGLARLLGEPLWVQPDTVPTHQAWYAAPEQGLTTDIDSKVDVYSLCLSLNEAVTAELPFKSDSTVNTLANRVGRLMPVSADLGPLAQVFERAGRPEPADRWTASEFGRALVGAASKLPRPEPLPLLSSGLFEIPADQMRAPDDPTGGLSRPSTPQDLGQDLGPPAAPSLGPPDEATTEMERPQIGPLDLDAGDREPDTELDIEPTEPVLVGGDEPTEAVAIFEAQPDVEAPKVDPQEDLVILPLDATIERPRRSEMTATMPATQAPAPPPPVTAPLATTAGVATTNAAPASQHKGRRGLVFKLAFALLLVAALVAIYFAAGILFRTKTHTVPDLVGTTAAEARNLVSMNEWVVSTEAERSDEVPEPGRIVRTVPVAGTALAEGDPFLIVVSEGPTLRELPDSTNLTLAEAQAALIELGLNVAAAPTEFSEDVPAGNIISWRVPGDPTLKAGSLVEPGVAVELVVSDGPAPRTVPNITGMPVEQARAALEELGLTLQVDSQEFSNDIAEGGITFQNIAADAMVERGTQIRVVTSAGPDLVAFPDLSGAANYNEAQQILADAGFTAELTLGDAEGSEFSYTIDGQEPPVGAEFLRGTVVQFQAV